MALRILSILWLFLFIQEVKSQSKESPIDTAAVLTELLNNYTNKVDSIKTLLNEQKSRNEKPKIWETKFGGLLGFDFNNFMNWVSQGDNSNSSSSSISTSIDGQINKLGNKFFWRNTGKLTLGWRNINNSTTESGFQKTIDLLNINTHIGNKVNEKLALSVLGEWRSNLLSQNIAPSYLDMSLGITWTPEEHILAIVHPINYELILGDADAYESSIGSKLRLAYDHAVSERLHLKSNLSGFMSYKSLSDLTNYTWTNGVDIKVVENLGIGLEYAMRVSPQETQALSNVEDFQSYVIMGVSFVL